MVDFSQIFNATDYDLMVELDAVLRELESDIAKAEHCGIDCEHRKIALADLRRRHGLQMAAIFPNGRPAQ